MMINKRILIITGLLMMIFVSCKQQEKIARKKFQSIRTDEEIEKLIFTGNDEIKTIKLAKIKFKISINDESYESGGNIAILKDSLIIISVVPLMGFEIARIYCLKDNILVLNRPDKTYYYSPYEKKIGPYYVMGEFNDLESILTGRAFIYRGESMSGQLKKKSIKESGYIKYFFEMHEKNFVKSLQKITVREENLLMEKNEISDYKNHFGLFINYMQFKTTGHFVLPDEISIIANNADDRININISIGSVTINEAINANIVIPEKYKEITME